jgi:hypothetical protein
MDTTHLPDLEAVKAALWDEVCSAVLALYSLTTTGKKEEPSLPPNAITKPAMMSKLCKAVERVNAAITAYAPRLDYDLISLRLRQSPGFAQSTVEQSG